MSPPVLVDDITAVTYEFQVKWRVPCKDLKIHTTSDTIFNHTLTSNRYRFKNVENFEFSYILLCGRNYKMIVECVTDMPLFHEDVLVLIKDSIYRVECTPTNSINKLIFDPVVLEENSFEDDIVTFHCIMSIPAEIKATIIHPEDDKTSISIVECESLIKSPKFYPYDYDAINKFRYSGRVPDFHVKTALKMLDGSHQRHNPILKALCAEYLMENLTTENVTEVLKQAFDSEAKLLAQKCLTFLSEHCRVVPLK